MKKAISTILTAAMVAGMMTGCGSAGGSTNTQESAGSSAGDDQVVIDVFQNKNEISDALQAAIDTYEEKNPNVKINLETVGGSDYASSLKAKMLGNDPVEIFTLGGPDDIASYQEYLEPLTDQEWVSHVTAGGVDNVTVDGEVYGLPLAIEGYGLIYNKKIFEAAGIDASTLTTYDAIDKAFADLQKQIDEGKLAEEFPVLEAVEEYAAKESWIVGLHTNNVALSQEFKSAANAFNSKTVAYTYGDQLKDLIDLETKYTSSKDNLSLLNSVDYSTQVGGGLAIERVAVVQQGNWISSEVSNVSEDVLDNLGILPIPLKGVVEDSIAVGVSNYWCVNSKSSDAEKKAAKDFLNWLYQSDEGKEIVVNNLGFIPAFDNYDNVSISDPLSAEVKRYVDAGKTIPWVFSGQPSGWDSKVAANIQNYLAGSMTWDEVIAQNISDWESMREQ
nr:ABC transporter substrate-binding protein [uncultured Blautia sp.]